MVQCDMEQKVSHEYLFCGALIQDMQVIPHHAPVLRETLDMVFQKSHIIFRRNCCRAPAHDRKEEVGS